MAEEYKGISSEDINYNYFITLTRTGLQYRELFKSHIKNSEIETIKLILKMYKDMTLDSLLSYGYEK